MRILVVEDEEAIAKGLRFNFEREGYQVNVAGDGPTALEIYESAQPPIDLVVLDLMLPKMDGLEVCRVLRKDMTVPILMLTTESSADRKVEGKSAGATGWLVKPFDPEKLIDVVKRVSP